jgi:hypothetical protein
MSDQLDTPIRKLFTPAHLIWLRDALISGEHGYEKARSESLFLKLASGSDQMMTQLGAFRDTLSRKGAKEAIEPALGFYRDLEHATLRHLMSAIHAVEHTESARKWLFDNFNAWPAGIPRPERSVPPPPQPARSVPPPPRPEWRVPPPQPERRVHPSPPPPPPQPEMSVAEMFYDVTDRDRFVQAIRHAPEGIDWRAIYLKLIEMCVPHYIFYNDELPGLLELQQRIGTKDAIEKWIKMMCNPATSITRSQLIQACIHTGNATARKTLETCPSINRRPAPAHNNQNAPV